MRFQSEFDEKLIPYLEQRLLEVSALYGIVKDKLTRAEDKLSTKELFHESHSITHESGIVAACRLCDNDEDDLHKPCSLYHYPHKKRTPEAASLKATDCSQGDSND